MTKIRQHQGHILHATLETIFQMVELGGSYVQKYDAMTRTFEPDRTLTPFVIRPQLFIIDKEGYYSAVDYAYKLINVAWTLTLKNGSSQTALSNTHYTIDAVSKQLTLRYNVQVGMVLSLSFSADFLDNRRNEVHHFSWDRDITSLPQTAANISLEHGQWPSKLRLSPFKNWGEFQLPVQLKNGNKDVPDTSANYEWQWWNKETKSWESDMSECSWYVSGAKTKAITVSQDYIQNVLLRVRCFPLSSQEDVQTFVIRLRRWYGQYEEDVEFLTGKYVFNDTNLVAIEGKVTNRQGNISNIPAYFDCQLFFAVGDEKLERVAIGSEAIIKRTDLQKGRPRAGILVRELTAFMPLATPNGEILVDGEGNALFAQFPSTEIEEE